MPQYVLLLYDNLQDAEKYAEMSPEEMQRIVEKYGAWSGRLAQQGRIRGGEKLRDGSGRVMRRGSNGVSVKDGPFVETKEVVGGYFILEAADYDEAARLCEDCPHLEFGGTIEVREIEPMGEPAQG